MKRNVWIVIGLLFLLAGAAGCCTTGNGYSSQPYNQGYAQPQQPIFGGGYQQPVATTQEALGRFGRNLGSRVSNGIINRGVNHLINGVFSGF